MALPLGKLTILVGAGIIGSVLAKEGRLPDVSGALSGALKLALKQFKRDDSPKTISKPRNDSLMAQVNSLREELQLLATSRPVTIVTGTGTGATRYGVVVVIVVVGCGYVWWKGWKLPDMMFATKRSLSDACNAVAQQLESVYASIRKTRRELSSSIERVDFSLNEVAELTANTQDTITKLRDGSEKFGHEVRSVRSAVETLELKISRIEGKQDLTTLGVKNLCDYAYSLENNLLEENGQNSPSSSRITFSSKPGALPPPPQSEPSTPSASNGSSQDQMPRQNGLSSSRHQRSNGISGVVNISSGPAVSNSTRESEETRDGTSSWLRPAFLSRTRSATNAVLRQNGSSKQS